MKFLHLLLALGLAIVSFVSALPLDGHELQHNNTRRSQDNPPTVAEIMVFMRQKWDGSRAVFWTRPGLVSDAANYARAYKGQTIESLLAYEEGGTKINKIDDWSKADGSNRDAVIRLASEAFAELADNPTVIMLQPNAVPQPNAVWTTTEAPVLRRRGVKVAAVDPNDWDNVWNSNLLGV